MITRALPVMLLASCGMAPAGNGVVAGDLPAGNTQIGRSASGPTCARPTYCGDIGYVDCQSDRDGPAYYFRRDNGEIISACGGYCMGDPHNSCARNCPPPQWTCRERRQG